MLRQKAWRYDVRQNDSQQNGIHHKTLNCDTLLTFCYCHAESHYAARH